MALRRIITSFVLAIISASSVFASYVVEPSSVRADQQNLRWKSRQIRVALSVSLTQPSVNIKHDSDVVGALLRSFKEWEKVANIEFVTEMSEKNGISPAGPSGDGVSLITIAQTPENVLLFSKDPDRESAKTRVFYNGRGFITEADIVLNPFQQFSTDGSFGTFDLQATLTHEIGHLLGLRHSSVLGATMAEGLPKNGMFGVADLTARALSRNDIAAIRELYPSETAVEGCCGAVSGRITGPTGRALKTDLKVWAEESETGRVFAQADVLPDGSYRLGGLPDSTYSIFWQTKAEGEASSGGELGSVDVEQGSSPILNGKITPRRAGPEIQFIGINSRLANAAVPLSSGREHLVFLGGRNLDSGDVKIDFSSAYLRAASATYSRPDLGDASSVVSLLISVDVSTPAGLYSVYAVGKDGVKSTLIGALKID